MEEVCGKKGWDGGAIRIRTYSCRQLHASRNQSSGVGIVRGHHAVPAVLHEREEPLHLILERHLLLGVMRRVGRLGVAVAAHGAGGFDGLLLDGSHCNGFSPGGIFLVFWFWFWFLVFMAAFIRGLCKTVLFRRDVILAKNWFV